MASELGRLGTRVRIVASDLNLSTRAYSRRRSWKDPRTLSETVDGVDFVWLPGGSYRANDWRRAASMMIFSCSALAYVVRAPAPEGTIVIGSSPHLFGALAGWVAARLRRVPFVLEVRDMWPESYTAVTGEPDGWFVRFLSVLASFLYRRASLIVALTEANIERLASMGLSRDRLKLVPNGVDTAALLGADLALPSLGSPGQFTFVYAGAHGPANGLEYVLRACAKLQRLGAGSIRVVLMGDGPLKARLIDQAQTLKLRNVEFRDPVPKRQIGPLLQTADAGLMVLAPAALFTDGVSPNKLFDYLAAGLPVVTNVEGLVASIVLAADAGLVCRSGDAEALTDAMIRLEQAVSADRSLFRGGQKYVIEQFDRKHLAQELNSELAQLRASRAPIRRQNVS